MCLSFQPAPHNLPSVRANSGAGRADPQARKQKK